MCCRAMPAPKQPQVRPPPPASGSHPSSQHQAAAQTHPPAHPSSQHAPSGISNQSAQTSMAPKPPKGKASKTGKAPANVNYLSAQQPGVLENVYAAARKGQKEAMLVAMLLCKPCKDKVGSHHVWKHTDWCVCALTAAQNICHYRSTGCACSPQGNGSETACWQSADIPCQIQDQWSTCQTS